jgi:5-(carboxyamino)imidazole ribonucleotide mutase
MLKINERIIKMADAVVGIVMGSDSDWPLVKKACETLDKFGVAYETRVISAHRTPDVAIEYSKTAEERGLKVIIAAAGGAAHLGGVLAAATGLPVIGIPCKSSNLDGMDALLSTVQMPTGVPVATVAINGAGNAGLLAVQILALSDEDLANKLEEKKENDRKEVYYERKDQNSLCLYQLRGGFTQMDGEVSLLW